MRVEFHSLNNPLLGDTATLPGDRNDLQGCRGRHILCGSPAFLGARCSWHRDETQALIGLRSHSFAHGGRPSHSSTGCPNASPPVVYFNEIFICWIMSARNCIPLTREPKLHSLSKTPRRPTVRIATEIKLIFVVQHFQLSLVGK